MARRAALRGRFGPRRSVDWSASAPLTGYAAVAASSAVLLETFVPVTGGETVIRTRGLFSFKSDQSAASEENVGALGIAVVTAQAVSVGITAIPHPVTDAAWGGWFYHTYFSRAMLVLSGVGVDPNNVMNIVIDSKAARKVDEDERLVVVIENSSAAGMEVTTMERFLSKLH